MSHTRRARLLWSLIFLLALGTSSTRAGGFRLYKSGPIQITADGATLWVAHEAADSVARITTANDSVLEIALPDPGVRDAPKGISVSEDGSTVWVTAHDSDRVYVLDGENGSLLQQIDLPWGSGPYSVALSRPAPPDDAQGWALVTLHRSESLAAIDTSTYAVTLLQPVYHSPLGVAWTEDGTAAWVSHLFAGEEHPRLSRIDFSGSLPKVTSRLSVGAATPRHTGQLSNPDASKNVAEGGYLNFRGHLAQLPSGETGGRLEMWIPTQYHNMTNDDFSPDSTIQATLRKLDLTTREVSQDDKVVFTAVQVHSPTAGDNNPPWVGYGWDAKISGAVDLGFVKVGGALYGIVLGEQSNDALVFPWDTPPFKSATDPNAPGLPEVPLGDRPRGIVVSPTADAAYIYNSLSFDVSVLDLTNPLMPFEDRRIALAAPTTGLLADTNSRRGAQLFHTSADSRVSSNQKVACSSCHINAEHDGRIWGLHNLPPGSMGQGHGPRGTPSLLGIALTHTPGQTDPDYGQLGEIHRSGDRDEIQDFEHTLQGPQMGGTGFLGVGVQPELGPPNQGLDTDLDAMSDYLLALPALARSPHRSDDGTLTDAAVRGATFFVGSDTGNKPADASCASCHVPETGFVDFRFHDVGQRRDGSEQELNDPSRPCNWCVNTSTLIGVWTGFPFGGVLRFTESFLDTLVDFKDPARSAPHGSLDGLTGRQLEDLAEFVLSVDGSTSASEVRDARDTAPPRIVRVEPTAKTRVEVWFDESVDPVSSAVPGNYRIVRQDTGEEIPVIAVAFDGQNGDRVSLTTQLLASCAGVDYRLEPAGPILDVADRATDGVANAIDTADLANQHGFSLPDTLSVTLGASGYEQLTVSVHDASPVGPGLQTWGHDSLQPFDFNGQVNPAFLRFDWRGTFVQVTGVASSADLIEARVSAIPHQGDAQPVEIRRVLQSWSDPPTGGDWNNNPVGGPTWRDHAHPNQPWNIKGAKALGGTGADPQDYNAGFDLAAAVDAIGSMAAINEPMEFAATAVRDAFRFWYDNPSLDYGYALRVSDTPPAQPFVQFHRGESDLRRHAPRLTLTYRVSVPAPVEVSPPGAPDPLLVGMNSAGLLLSFADLGALAGTYNVYEGQIGSWYSHAGAACNQAPVQVGGRLEIVHASGPGDRYFLVTASDCEEGTAGNDGAGVERDPGLLDCLP